MEDMSTSSAFLSEAFSQHAALAQHNAAFTWGLLGSMVMTSLQLSQTSLMDLQATAPASATFCTLASTTSYA